MRDDSVEPRPDPLGMVARQHPGEWLLGRCLDLGEVFQPFIQALDFLPDGAVLAPCLSAGGDNG